MEPDTDNSCWTPLHLAAWHGHLYKISVDILRAVPMDETGWFKPNHLGCTPFANAVRKGNLPTILNVMKRKGITLPVDETGWLRPDKKNETVLHLNSGVSYRYFPQEIIKQIPLD